MYLENLPTARVASDFSFDANFDAAAEESLWDSVENSVLQPCYTYAVALLSSSSKVWELHSICGRVRNCGHSIIVVKWVASAEHITLFLCVLDLHPPFITSIHSLTACKLVYEFHHDIQFWKKLKLNCLFVTPKDTTPTCFGVITPFSESFNPRFKTW
jgi:hypothetical protein